MAKAGPVADQKTLRLHQVLPRSYANGPGARAVIWVQGCTLGCPGCFNPLTHPNRDDQIVAIDDLYQQIVGLGDSIEGVTISGGEPLQQRPAVAALLRLIRQNTSLSVILFTGFSWQELVQIGVSEGGTPDLPLPLLADVDVLLAGRYQQAQHIGRDLRGSSNKTSHFLTDRYTAADLAAIPPAEIVITPDGAIIASGIEPVKF